MNLSNNSSFYYGKKRETASLLFVYTLVWRHINSALKIARLLCIRAYAKTWSGVEPWSGVAFLESNFGVSFADFSLDNQTESTNRHTDRQTALQTDRHNNTQRCRLVLTDR